MAVGEVTATSRGRKSSTPSGSSSRPSSTRPLAPKRAHTSTASSTTLRSFPAARANPFAVSANDVQPSAAQNATSPLLSPDAARSRTPHTSIPKTPSPNYFGLKIEDDASNPPDSDAGKHAKRNWGVYPGGNSGEMPIEEDPQYASFRRQSQQQNGFRLAQAGLSRFSTDGRVPTLKSLKEAQRIDGVEQQDFEDGDHRHPLSAGGRVQISSVQEQAQGDEMEMDPPAHITINDRDEGDSYFGLPRYDSPQPEINNGRPEIKRNPLSSIDSKHPRGSMPQTRVTTPVATNTSKTRADTLPTQFEDEGPQFISVSELHSLYKDDQIKDALLLDLRVSPQYAQSRVREALNLCIPTTLLKRPAFNIQKLSETFNSPEEKEKFCNWKDMSHIIVYDASSAQLKDAQSAVNTLKKFRTEGYEGRCLIVKGGFNSIANAHPDIVTKNRGGLGTKGSLRLSLGSKAGDATSSVMPVAGGCPMPDANNQPANPFFGSIRQNMDLIDGVGQMSIKRPPQLNENNLRGLPSWMRDVLDEEEEGKLASERFLAIEKAEQSRLQKAYTTQVQYGNPASRTEVDGNAKRGNVQIAGIEKGTKNRYKDILPYEHSRVVLQRTDSDGSDYINASHIKVEWCNRSYISTQAPVPNTFEDFWSLIWEQDVRVIVALTAEMEGGQRKCHPYWLPDTYGDVKVKTISEKRVSLERPTRASLLDPNRKVSMPLSQMLASKEHPSRMQRRATLMGEGDVSSGAQANANGPDAPAKESPSCVVRKLAVTNKQEPFVPLREIVQVMYTNWPDFGAPAEAGELLSLVEQVDEAVRVSNTAGQARRNDSIDNITSPIPSSLKGPEDDESKWPAPPRERPVVAHCSAGCGRTGTFITVDAVVDMLKRQRLVGIRRRNTDRGQSQSRVSQGLNFGRFEEKNPFDSMAAVTIQSPTDSIVSPTSHMDIDGKGPGTAFGNKSNIANYHETIQSDDDESDDDEDIIDLDNQDWVGRDDIDLVQKTVEELRLQRLSMVQNLRQFTLCYESVVEWIVREMPERFRRDNFRKSYQG